MAAAGMLLGDLAHRGGVLWPGRTAFAWSDRHRTYGELAERVRRMRALLAAAGLRRGDRIALLTVNVPEAIELAMAASGLGAVVVPLNVRLSAAEIAFQVEDSGAVHAVVHPGLDDLARQSGLLELPHWTIGPELDARLSAAPAGGGPAGESRPAEDAPVMQLYTSGTTGRPKGCLLTNRGWVVAAANAVQAFGLTGADRLLGALPLFHVAGYGTALGHLAVGGTVVLPTGAETAEPWPLIAAHAITVAIFPGGTGRALRHPDAATRSLRLVYGMAGTERPRTLAALRATGCDYRGVYGSTEAGNFVTVSTLSDELARPGTVGRPLPAFDVEVTAAGELLIRGASLMAGYAGLPEATAQALAGGWLHTGDLLRVDEDGYLYFVDRAKDMIKTGGENVYSAEVERVLAAHPKVADVAVIGVPDRRWGQAVKAVVVARGPVEAAELDAHCLRELGAFKRPRWYELVDAIPRNHSGKILKTVLRDAHDPATAERLPERATS
ncbi:MAG: class I adenylate-forming enzyme family protein [Actinomadura sp.]